ncbi:DCC-interacting protein 13-beta [Polypterus senegalus]|uniref:DCC-interacting protein 13-beta n=1 Tax=Polypterus senegalus TaxID=55291 RepID=UPI001964052C|nr:DCC-interacting protein 13-beta [Polypterus senegalus]
MPATDRLLLEEALQDSPQTRSLFSVFEEDAGTLTDYTNQLLQSMQRVYGAQNEMSLATQQLSQQLQKYEKQNFALGKGDEEVIGVLQQFATIVDKLNLLHEELARRLADSMVFPMVQFREKDLTEIGTLKEIYSIASEEHDSAMAKYSRLPKKRESEKLKAEVISEVAYTRRKQHQASMQYYCALNALQHRKKVAMLEPMLGYMHAQMAFFHKSLDMMSHKVADFLSSVEQMSQSIQVQLDAETEAMRQSQQELLSVDDTVYMPDQDACSPLVNRSLVQRAGYLNIRSKTGLVTTSWDRLYFFTQGGNLMCQPRGAVAGGLVMDLDNSSVMAVDCEDRRYCFQITTPNGKICITLQAESKRDYEEWICTLNNISRQIYLTDNPEAVAIRLNQTALQAVTPIISFEKKHENYGPNSKLQPTSAEPPPGRLQQEPDESAELITAGTPIQFDLVLPASEFEDQNRCGAGRRTNPFGESSSENARESEDSLLHQMFVVRFLGSMEVKSDQSKEVIYEAMRQVLAARAIHNIFRMTESHLVVTTQCLRLVDPQTQVTRMSLQLSDITQFAAHQENKRLIGFVAVGADISEGLSPKLQCYVFESNTEGEKVCYAVSLGKEIIEAQKDPEALAELMKTVPLTSDGKFLLLESETHCDEQAGDPVGLESEA